MTHAPRISTFSEERILVSAIKEISPLLVQPIIEKKEECNYDNTS